MKQKYLGRQSLMIFNQLLLVVCLCYMKSIGVVISNGNTVHFVLLTLLFCDAYYISYKNVKGNAVLTQFATLLILFGWHFWLSLFETYLFAETAAVLILPICLYQLVNFVQAFIFQGSSYKGKRVFLTVLKLLCSVATISFFIERYIFYIIYTVQLLTSFAWCVFVAAVHHKRIGFVLRSQKKQFLYSTVFVLLPFICYAAIFFKQEEYVEQMGLYLIVMLAFVSVHSIIFRPDKLQEHFFTLSWCTTIFLFAFGVCSLFLVAPIFELPATAVFVVVYLLVLWGLLYHLLLFLKVSKTEKNTGSLGAYQNFYEYSLSQLKREEALRKDFSNYLHDDVLQDLLSIKNLIRKAGQPEIQQLLEETLRKLTVSIRSQMQVYHPKLLKSLTFKENIQSVLDSITNENGVTISLDCKDETFLVEPYTMLVCRITRELVVNALKHSHATRIDVELQQEDNTITLQVTDNGIGFSAPSDERSPHHGLTSVQEQVSLLNGSMTIRSHSDEGTSIVILIPMKGDDSYASFVGR